MDKNGAIGLIDSGVGGLTVLAKAVELLPNENFIYLGDSKNCPYGNRSREELLKLGRSMLKFLQEKQVKCVMLACNTMSSLGDALSDGFPFPVFRIVSCAADCIEDKSLKSVGVLATEFTIKSGLYQKVIENAMPDCKVFGVGSKNLARLVEAGDLRGDEIRNEIKLCIDKMLDLGDIHDVIMGCTHFPIVLDVFKNMYPEISFIDPAAAQCRYLQKNLKEMNAENNNGGRLEIYTTGNINEFLNMADYLKIKKPDKAGSININ